MTDTVLYWDKIEVTEKDADLLDRDMMLYGNAYVETFETGPARRIDPRSISHLRETGSVDLGIVKEDV